MPSSRTSRQKVLSSEENLMLLKEVRDGTFSVRLLYKVLDGMRAIVFPQVYLEYLGAL